MAVRERIVEWLLDFVIGHTSKQRFPGWGNFIPQVDRLGNIHTIVREERAKFLSRMPEENLWKRLVGLFIRDEIVERLRHRRVGHSNKLETGLLDTRDGLLRWERSA